MARRIYIVVAVCGVLWTLAEAGAALMTPDAPSVAVIVSGSVKGAIALILAGLLLVLVTRYERPIERNATHKPLRYVGYDERVPDRRTGALPDALDESGTPIRRRATDIEATERVQTYLQEQALAKDLDDAQEA